MKYTVTKQKYYELHKIFELKDSAEFWVIKFLPIYSHFQSQASNDSVELVEAVMLIYKNVKA